MTWRRAAGFACATVLPWLAIVLFPSMSAVCGVALCMYAAARLLDGAPT